MDVVPKVFNPIRSGNMEIFSNASMPGWGAYCGGELTFGIWIESKRKQHINYLILVAAFYVLKCSAKDSSGCKLLLRFENTTAIQQHSML